MLQLRLLVLAIAVLAVGVVIGMGMSLGGSQPASADDLEMDAQAFLDAFCSSTAIPADTEVEINEGTSGSIGSCTLKLNPGSEVEFEKDVEIDVTNDFKMENTGADTGEREVEFGEGNTVNAGKIEWKLKGEEVEIKAKKGTEINSRGDIIIEAITEGVDSDDADIEFEENTLMGAGGKIDLYVKSSGDDADDAEIKFKKVSDEALLDTNKEFAMAPNITAVTGIFMKAESTDEAEVAIEESNFLEVTNGEIKLEALGSSTAEGEMETKKFVQLTTDNNNKDITLKSTGSESELTVDENNVFLAGTGTILIDPGAGGELEIKSDTTTWTFGALNTNP